MFTLQIFDNILIILIQSTPYYQKSQIKSGAKQASPGVQAITSPVKIPTGKAMGISSMGNTNSEMNSRQGFRPAMHYSDTPQMGGLKSSMQSNLNHRLPSSHQRMESGDIQYSSIRNGGRNIVCSKRNIIAKELTEKEMELQQVPIKSLKCTDSSGLQWKLKKCKEQLFTELRWIIMEQW